MKGLIILFFTMFATICAAQPVVQLVPTENTQPITGTVVAVSKNVHYVSCKIPGSTLVLINGTENVYLILCGTNYKVGDQWKPPINVDI